MRRVVASWMLVSRGGFAREGSTPLVEVRVVKVGSGKPARVLVRFVADEFEGREEWVPPARLKVPWSGVDAFVAKESRWDVVSASPVHDTAEHYATSTVFDER